MLALIVRAANSPVEYDSDDELIAPRQQIRQPLINRPPAPATGVPVAGTLDQRPSRNDAWSTRMREKVKYPVKSILFIHKIYSMIWIVIVTHVCYNLTSTKYGIG